MLTAVALVCTWVPFYKALRVCLRGWSATRRVDLGSLRKGGAAPTGATEPISMLMMRILKKSLRDNESEHPSDFVFDASRQYVMNEFEANYTRLISMFGSLRIFLDFTGGCVDELCHCAPWRAQSREMQTYGYLQAGEGLLGALG